MGNAVFHLKDVKLKVGWISFNLVRCSFRTFPPLERPCIIPCPTCRVPSVLTLGKIRDMKTDFNVQQLIDLHHKYKFKDPSINEALAGLELSCSRCYKRMEVETGKPDTEIEILGNTDDSEVVKGRIVKEKEVLSSPPKVCLMCDIVLCSKCAPSHSLKNETHYEVDVTSKTWKVLFCQEHGFKMKKSFCMEENCQLTLCSVCLLSDEHEEHEIVWFPDVIRSIQEKIHSSKRDVEAYERDLVKEEKSVKVHEEILLACIEEEATKMKAIVDIRKNELLECAQLLLKDTSKNNKNLLYNIHRGEWLDSVQKCKEEDLDKDINQIIQALQNENHPIYNVISFDRQTLGPIGEVEETIFESLKFDPSDDFDLGLFKYQQKVGLHELKPGTENESNFAEKYVTEEVEDSEEENTRDCSESSGKSPRNCNTGENDNDRIDPTAVKTGPNSSQLICLDAPFKLKILNEKERAAEKVCHSKIDNSNKSTGLKCDNTNLESSSVVRFNSSSNNSDETSDGDLRSNIQVVGAEARGPCVKGKVKSLESKMLKTDYSKRSHSPRKSAKVAESGARNYSALPSVVEDSKSSEIADREKKTNAPGTSMSFKRNLKSNGAPNEAPSTSTGLSGTTHKTRNPNKTKAETSKKEKHKKDKETKK